MCILERISEATIFLETRKKGNRGRKCLVAFLVSLIQDYLTIKTKHLHALCLVLAATEHNGKFPLSGPMSVIPASLIVLIVRVSSCSHVPGLFLDGWRQSFWPEIPRFCPEFPQRHKNRL